MTGYQGSYEVSKKQDTFDSMFEWAERAFCPAAMKTYKPEPKEDTLDYVFEHVESFTCRDDRRPEPKVIYEDHGIERDNSLVEVDGRGVPAQMQTQRQIRPLGQEGDVMDYVFEHVESFVCNEQPTSTEPRAVAVTPQKEDENMEYKAAKQRLQNVFEPEDEIQLFFRPSRRRRKKKGSV